ncbi:MAG: hypothetical protein U9R75_10905, partial [Candidatus Thermoplasmatota archaeon]|nr:hypothetical protein [Candidatus Thermoplasmatota archaeon]
MTGKSKYCASGAAVLFVLLMLVQPMGIIDGGPTRASGTDIVVSSITSHSEGQIIALEVQIVSVVIENNGTIDHLDPVKASLNIYYPANKSDMSLVHSNTTDLGTSLSWVGNQTSISFPNWMPLEEGYYAINVSVDAFDDHPGNNSINITVRAILGDPVDFEIFVEPESRRMRLDPGDTTKDPGKFPYRFQVRNDGIDPDTFIIDITSEWVMPGWATSTGVVLPGERSAWMEVDIEVPDGAVPNIDIDVLIFKVTSTNDPNVEKYVTVNTTLVEYASVDVTVISEKTKIGYPGGDWVIFDFLVTNTGTDYDSYELEVNARPPNWIARFPGGSTK